MMDADSVDAERQVKSLLAMLEDERTKGAASRQHIEQLQAKLHCMCGSEINHSAWEGHSPVSMYDYALDEANTRAERAEAQLACALDSIADLLAIIESPFIFGNANKINAAIAKAHAAIKDQPK